MIKSVIPVSFVSFFDMGILADVVHKLLCLSVLKITVKCYIEIIFPGL